MRSRAIISYTTLAPLLILLLTQIFKQAPDPTLVARIQTIVVQNTVIAEKPIHLLFAGDMMFDRAVEKKIETVGKGDYNFPFLLILDYLRSFDGVITNLEGPISDRGTKVGSIYSFEMNPETAKALKNANIKAVQFANNHVWDYGKQAFEDTLLHLKENDIVYIGAGNNADEAYAPVILDINGTRIGLLAFSEFLKNIEADPPSHEVTDGQGNALGIAVIDDIKIKQAIENARDKVDVLAVLFHWGNEYQQKPRVDQIARARRVIDWGADMVIGNHPHVVQISEVYKEKPIYYSLGNFVFDQNFSKETMEAGLLEVTIQDKKIQSTVLKKAHINKDFQVISPVQ